jgi:tubulin beta
LNRPRGNQLGTQFLEAVCDEHGIGGSGEYCGDNDAHLGRFNVIYHEAFGGKYVSRAVLFDLEPGVIGAVTPSRLSANSSA